MRLKENSSEDEQIDAVVRDIMKVPYSKHKAKAAIKRMVLEARRNELATYKRKYIDSYLTDGAFVRLLEARLAALSAQLSELEGGE